MKKRKKIVDGFLRDFISNEKREYRYKLGTLVASALAGFVGGFIFASIAIGIAIYYISIMAKIAQ